MNETAQPARHDGDAVSSTPTACPIPAEVTTARDLAVLAVALMQATSRSTTATSSTQRLRRSASGRIETGVKFVELYSPYAEGLKTGFICASGFNIVGSAVRDGRRLIAVALGFRRADLRDEFLVRLFDEAFALKTGGQPAEDLAAAQRGRRARQRCSGQGECGTIRYDMPGDAAWLGTYGDWARRGASTTWARPTSRALGATRPGKEWILPVTVNKATRQAAIIADLEPDAAQKLCAAYKARKLFCEMRKPDAISRRRSGAVLA